MQTATAAPTRRDAQATLETQVASSTESIATSVPTVTDKAEDGKKITAVGAGVGVGVGVPLLAALGAVLFLYLREKRITKVLRGQLASSSDQKYYAEGKPPYPQGHAFQELQTNPQRHQTGPQHYQLQGNRQDVNAELDSSVTKNAPY